MVVSYAPAKVILVGEHAVVYGVSAVAIPVLDLQASCEVVALTDVESESPQNDCTSSIVLELKDMGIRRHLCLEDAKDPFAVALAGMLRELHVSHPIPRCVATVKSAIPPASGMGSSASVLCAFIKCMSHFLGCAPPPPEVVARCIYEAEKIHHGTPSGIDNTVVSYAQPILFRRGSGSSPNILRPLSVKEDLLFLIADSGLPGSTAEIVGDVAKRYNQEGGEGHWDSPCSCRSTISAIRSPVEKALDALERGDARALGAAMNENHALLQNLGVSSKSLDDLVDAAVRTGAMGAKLTGAGRGGCVIALVDQSCEESVRKALMKAGAVRIHRTVLTNSRTQS